MNGKMISLKLRRQKLRRNPDGANQWQVEHTTLERSPAQMAILLCDVWDKHWSRGAMRRLEKILPRMNEVVGAARNQGVQIIHAPSETMDFYAETQARQRMIEAPFTPPPMPLGYPEPPLPIDASDGGSDTDDKSYKAWSRQHPAIEIDDDQDGITDKGQEVYNFLQYKGINHLIIIGVHTNMCVLNRSFAIKQMVKWGVKPILVRDLTDAMYNPAKPPYVSHEQGTQLVVQFIEKFWCPTISSLGLMRNF